MDLQPNKAYTIITEVGPKHFPVFSFKESHTLGLDLLLSCFPAFLSELLILDNVVDVVMIFPECWPLTRYAMLHLLEPADDESFI